MLRIPIVVPALILVAWLAACDEKKPIAAAPATRSAPAAAALPPSLFLSAAPADAKDIKDAKGSAKVGDKIILVGRIGGSKEPFVAQRAVFTLVDKRLKACGEGTAMDSCETPWDYCCETREEITANSAAVQVVDAGGQPIKAELNGVNGLKLLATVTVVGTVVTAEAGNLVVRATGLYVQP